LNFTRHIKQTNELVWMIRDFCVRCQYRYLRIRFHSNELSALVRPAGGAAAENVAIRSAGTFGLGADRVGDTFILVWVKENHNVHS
jgi:hypothetical protein